MKKKQIIIGGYACETCRKTDMMEDYFFYDSNNNVIMHSVKCMRCFDEYKDARHAATNAIGEGGVVESTVDGHKIKCINASHCNGAISYAPHTLRADSATGVVAYTDTQHKNLCAVFCPQNVDADHQLLIEEVKNADGTTKGHIKVCKVFNCPLNRTVKDGYYYVGKVLQHVDNNKDNVCDECKATLTSTNVQPTDTYCPKTSNGYHIWKDNNSTSSKCNVKCTKCSHETSFSSHNGAPCTRCSYPSGGTPNVPSTPSCSHSNTGGWVNTNPEKHWKECNDCGEQVQEGEHHYSSGVCVDCKYDKRVPKEFPKCYEVCEDCNGTGYCRGTYTDGTIAKDESKLETKTCPDCNHTIKIEKYICEICGFENKGYWCATQEAAAANCGCSNTEFHKNNGDNEHENRPCETCNEEGYTDVNHTEVVESETKATCTNTGIKKIKCSEEGCTWKDTETTPKTGHKYDDWEDNGDGTHQRICTNTGCGNIDGPYDCEYKYGTCQCGAKEPCKHTGLYSIENKGQVGHVKICKTCTKEIPNTLENHSMTKYEDNKDGRTHKIKCSVEGCGYYENDECTYRNGECIACKGKQQGSGTCSHINTEWIKTESQHKKICRDCGEEVITESNHNWSSTYTDNKDGTHSRKCIECSYIEERQHQFNSVTGKCEATGCGAEKGTQQECTHIYEMTEGDETYHWEKCKQPGCGKEKPNSKKAHNVQNWATKEETVHKGNCIDCGRLVEGSHNFTNGICNDCKMAEPKSECSHTYIIKRDGTEHWEECSKVGCGQEKANSRVKHTVTSWTDKGNGTHSGNCIVCNYEVADEHAKTSTGSCTICSYKPSSGGNNNVTGGNNGGTSGGNNTGTGGTTITTPDNTQSGTKIPQTGNDGKIVITSITALVILGIVAGVNLKKYIEVE